MSDILRAIIIKTTQDVLIDDECKSFILVADVEDMNVLIEEFNALYLLVQNTNSVSANLIKAIINTIYEELDFCLKHNRYHAEIKFPMLYLIGVTQILNKIIALAPSGFSKFRRALLITKQIQDSLKFERKKQGKAYKKFIEQAPFFSDFYTTDHLILQSHRYELIVEEMEVGRLKLIKPMLESLLEDSKEYLQTMDIIEQEELIKKHQVEREKNNDTSSDDGMMNEEVDELNLARYALSAKYPVIKKYCEYSMEV